jgi:predicted RNA-binding protein with PUA-like domain
MAIWLLKTEPSVYGWEDLARDGETMWDGVTQPQALIYLRQIEAGDTAIFYHTGDERSCIGTARVTRGAYVNPEGGSPKLAVCDIALGAKWKKPVTLAQIKAHPQLQGWDLIRLSRLSVVPTTPEQMQVLLELAQA